MWLFILGLLVGATLGGAAIALFAGRKVTEMEGNMNYWRSQAQLRSDRYSGGVQSLSQDREEKKVEKFLNYILDKHHDGERWPLE